MNPPVDALAETAPLPAVVGMGDPLHPHAEPDPSVVASSSNRFEDYVRQHPGATLLMAVGLGFAAVLVGRALTPDPPARNRAVRLLEDIQHRLTGVAQPAYDRIAGLAEDGAHAVGKGVDRLGDLHLNRKLGKLSRGFMNLFQ